MGQLCVCLLYHTELTVALQSSGELRPDLQFTAAAEFLYFYLPASLLLVINRACFFLNPALPSLFQFDLISNPGH